MKYVLMLNTEPGAAPQKAYWKGTGGSEIMREDFPVSLLVHFVFLFFFFTNTTNIRQDMTGITGPTSNIIDYRAICDVLVCFRDWSHHHSTSAKLLFVEIEHDLSSCMNMVKIGQKVTHFKALFPYVFCIPSSMSTKSVLQVDLGRYDRCIQICHVANGNICGRVNDRGCQLYKVNLALGII